MIGTLVIVVRVCLFCGPDPRNVYCRALVISYRFAPDSCFVGFFGSGLDGRWLTIENRRGRWFVVRLFVSVCLYGLSVRYLLFFIFFGSRLFFCRVSYVLVRFVFFV